MGTAKILIRLGAHAILFVCFFLSFFLSFFDEIYIRISLNYAVIKSVLSSKQCISFFLFFH